MKLYFSNASAKFRLFYPVFIGFLIALVLVVVMLISNAKNSIQDQALANLELEVKTIQKMFERERELKLEKVMINLKMAHELFYDQTFIIEPGKSKVQALNQITGNSHQVEIDNFTLDGKPLLNSKIFTDKTSELFGVTTTIFQKIDSGYLRISTNVLDDMGERAVGTYIPNRSPVIQTIENGNTYYGRAYVVNDWYITAYEPIYFNEEIIGILYVGDKEKDLDKLREILRSLKIGQTGYNFVFDNDGQMIIHPEQEDKNLPKAPLIKSIIENKNSSFQYHQKQPDINYLVASSYYNEFGFYIAAIVPSNELTAIPVRNIIYRAIIIGLIATALFVIIILTTTTKRVIRLLNLIEQSNVKLQSTRKALQQSEENFKTLFNSSSDEVIVTDMDANIIEINQVASDRLGYSRDEFLNMNIKDLKPEKFRFHVNENRNETIQKGSHVFESENVTKDGKVVAVEINSRLFDYQGKKAILSISRNIQERKALERKVLSAVIKTEEKERERFSKDMHDGLGPLLSAIKLYVNEINDKETTKEERESYIKQVNEMLDQAVTSTREISNNLMPRVIHDYGLVKAIESFCQKVNLTKKLDIQFNNSGIDKSLDSDVQLILFRVVSELINNTIKHAQAKNIKITLKKEDDHISLAFEDDGVGFNTDKVMNNPNTGIGLKSIISRVKSVNGRVLFKSFEGHGFKIYIDI